MTITNSRSLFPALLFALFLATGCGGSEEGEQPKSGDGRVDHGAIVQPRSPGVAVEVTGLGGRGDRAIWDEAGDGYRLSHLGAAGDGVNYELFYAGTTDAGDKYVFDVFVGESKQTKEIVYAGKEVEVPVTDKVKILLRPGS